MKVGDLVIQHFEGTCTNIRLIVAEGQKLYDPKNNTAPWEDRVLFFENGEWDWARAWRPVRWWDLE